MVRKQIEKFLDIWTDIETKLIFEASKTEETVQLFLDALKNYFSKTDIFRRNYN